MDDLGHYIAGLVDGEGCFSLCRENRDGNRFTLRPKFIINLKNDEEILLKIRDFIGCGSIYLCNRSMFRLEIRKLDDLQNKVVPFFEKYPLRAKKKYDFEYWKKIVIDKNLWERTSDEKTQEIWDNWLRFRKEGV